jgi:hypothetical protein
MIDEERRISFSGMTGDRPVGFIMLVYLHRVGLKCHSANAEDLESIKSGNVPQVGRSAGPGRSQIRWA